MPISDYEKNVLDNVEKHGWFGTHVFDPEETDPSFSYSTGFSKTLGKPEFIIFGLNKDLRHSMLWEIFRQMKDGKTPSDAQKWDDLLEGFYCVSKIATASNLYTEHVTTADWFWRHSGNQGHPEIYQMVWPGAVDGLFPWDEGCDPDVISQQPRLY